MFKMTPKLIHNEKVHKLLNNGWRFTIFNKNETPHVDHITQKFRYEYEARNRKGKSEKAIEIKTLLIE